jgi:putative tricarboxylic transport membrane protein
MKLSAFAVAGLMAWSGTFITHAHSQSAWRPTQNVEIIVPAAAGGANDLTGRLVQRIMQDAKLVPVNVNVVNRPGGGHSIGLAYLNQRPGDGHYLMIETGTMLVNEITGKLKVRHADITPIAVLYRDFVGISVRADSAIRTGRDFTDRLKADPASMTIALSSALANANHLAAAMLAKNAGADVKKMKIVVFNSGSETMTALLGGHVDAVAGPANLAARHLPEGKIRVLGIAAPRRLGGALAQVPTFTEQGTPGVIANWRSVIGPKNMTAAQLTYWDQVLAKVVQADEYKKEVERNLADPTYLGSREARKFWDREYEDLKTLLSELGLTT